MYVKLFEQLLDSSVWAEDDATRIVWITMLVMADEDGIVRARLPGISHRARVSPEDTKKALVTLSEPDAHSRTADYAGRRIEETDGGYVILNYKRYHDISTKATRREQTRKRVAAYRAKQKNDVTLCNAGVTQRNESVTQSDQRISQSNADKLTDSSSAPKTDSASELADLPEELEGLELYETDEKLLKAWPKLIVALAKAYPGVNIESEVAKAHAWEVANPERRKVKRGAFLHRWFARAQDRLRPSEERLYSQGLPSPSTQHASPPRPAIDESWAQEQAERAKAFIDKGGKIRDWIRSKAFMSDELVAIENALRKLGVKEKP